MAEVFGEEGLSFAYLGHDVTSAYDIMSHIL